MPLAVLFWTNPTFNVFFYSILAAITGTILHLCLGLAYKYADLSVTQPIWFSGLIFGSGFGYFVFKEIPDLWTWIGGIVVFASVLIITYNERNKDQKNNKNIISSID